MIVSLRTCCPKQLLRTAFSRSSSSSTRWKARQTNDAYAREARVAGLKSRAAFKLLEIHSKYRIFRRGDTVVDLGFAPGSWSQVAVSKTNPGGRVVGIDVIPAQPPPGANALQGNFLSMEMRDRLREFVGDQDQGRVGTRGGILQRQVNDSIKQDELTGEAETQEEQPAANEAAVAGVPAEDEILERHPDHEELAEQVSDEENGRVVNVVLSDMMMNTSGMAFRDHAGSMDLCMAALEFCYTTLATNGHFLTKFYMGAEDQIFEKRLRRLFHKVHRIKPDSSRKESKEAYFLALRRKVDVSREAVLGDVG